MNLLRARLAELLPVWRADIARLIRDHGEDVIGQVSVGQVLGGLRGARTLVCDTSQVEPETGLWIRGIAVEELADRLPEEVFWLLVTGRLPQAEELSDLQSAVEAQPELPDLCAAVVTALPSDTSVLIKYGAVLNSLQAHSRFAAAYGKIQRGDLWQAALNDALLLLRWCREAAALAYRHSAGVPLPRKLPEATDWAAQFAVQLGFAPDATLAQLLRLHFVVHSDHESGSASAFAAYVTGSALADPFRALSSALAALAGPIHGMASQTCLQFIQEVQRCADGVSTTQQVEQCCLDQLAAGKVIPGFGHAVLRGPDPRFGLLRRFGETHCADAQLFQTACVVYDTAPDVLLANTNIKTVHPNVDAISGVLLTCCGLRLPEFFTVLFSLGQSMGLLAQYVLARGLGLPIMRPRSVTLSALQRLCAEASP